MFINTSCLKTIVDTAAHPGPPEDGRYQSTSVFLLVFDKIKPHILAIQKADTEGYPWRNQVALPGGHIDPEDDSAMDAGFRELQEELNISRDQVDYVGSLGHFQTINHKDIQVFVGLWNGNGTIRHSPDEISRTLKIPAGNAGEHPHDPGLSWAAAGCIHPALSVPGCHHLGSYRQDSSPFYRGPVSAPAAGVTCQSAEHSD